MSKKRILIPVDGSPQSGAVVKYAARTMSRENTAVTLFHVRAKDPEAYLDFGAASYEDEDIPVDQWREMTREKTDRFLDESRKVFESEGFEKNAVETVSQSMEQGFARDVLNKSRDRFDAMAFGRHGFSSLGGQVLGGVAAKLIESAAHIPIVVVGGKPETGKILIAVDGSLSSKNAVECVCALAKKENTQVLLLSVVRPLNTPFLSPGQLFKQRHETHWVDANTRKMIPVLAEMRKRLIEKGFDGDLISETILREKKSRAEGIMSEARGRGFETVVVGRKGLTAVPEFVMGRVTRKILFMAGDRAVWIV